MATLVALLLVVAVGLPLVVRGPVLARLVAHETKHLCGSVQVEGGHVSVGVAAALLLQRPFEVALSGVVLRNPTGEEILRARTFRARVSVLRGPGRLEIDDALVADGAWRLVDKGFGEPLLLALDRVPRGGRAQCGEPEPHRPPGKPRRSGDLLTIRNLTLQNISLKLSFPIWALTLDSTDAQMSLHVLGKNGHTLTLFDIHDVKANRGGSLRVGPADAWWTPAVPFDRVHIAQVAILDTSPQDLLLEVKEGRTAEAVLSGTAVFKDIFDAGLPRGRAGMKLDARWTEFGQALRLNPNWAEVGTRLAALSAGLDVSLEGPFEALLGAAALTGKGLALSGRLLPRQHYGLDVRFDRLDTKPLLPPSWRDRLGGRLDGRM
ncbi:MAG TPA: hypothetical protein VIY56_01860, partial [Vicinamibacterales bacterium]